MPRQYSPTVEATSEPPPLNFPSCFFLPNMLRIEGNCQRDRVFLFNMHDGTAPEKQILSLGFTYKENRAAVPEK